MATSTPTIGLMSEFIPYHKEIMGELIDPSYPFVLLEMDLDKFEKILNIQHGPKRVGFSPQNHVRSYHLKRIHG